MKMRRSSGVTVVIYSYADLRNRRARLELKCRQRGPTIHVLFRKGFSEHQRLGAPVRRNDGLFGGRAPADGASGGPPDSPGAWVRVEFRQSAVRGGASHPRALAGVSIEEGVRARAGSVQAEEATRRCRAQAQGEGDEGCAQRAARRDVQDRSVARTHCVTERYAAAR